MLAVIDVVHRGGQHPGKICRGEIAVQLVDFMHTVGNKIALLLASQKNQTDDLSY